MKKRELTCIVCPRGCQMEVTLGDSGEVINVKGNACPRGASYASDECTNPKRTVTSTVFTECGSVISVKTSSAVPKEHIFDVMKEINRTLAPSDVKIGDIIITDVLGLGVDILATSNGEEV